MEKLYKVQMNSKGIPDFSMIKCTRIDCPFIGVKECNLEKCPYKTNYSEGADDDNA